MAGLTLADAQKILAATKQQTADDQAAADAALTESNKLNAIYLDALEAWKNAGSPTSGELFDAKESSKAAKNDARQKWQTLNETVTNDLQAVASDTDNVTAAQKEQDYNQAAAAAAANPPPAPQTQTQSQDTSATASSVPTATAGAYTVTTDHYSASGEPFYVVTDASGKKLFDATGDQGLASGFTTLAKRAANNGDQALSQQLFDAAAAAPDTASTLSAQLRQKTDAEQAEADKAAADKAAAQQVAATAATNPSDDTSKSDQTTPTTNTDKTQVTDQEQKNITQAATESSSTPVETRSLAPKNLPESPSDVSKATPPKNVGGNKQKTIPATPNPLDAYSSYAYGLTLHVLTRDDYNTLVETPHDFKPTKTLISSAGRYVDTRDPAFKEDFYFDELKFDTVIGLNAHARGTNVISVDFTIIEPYGMTLLDRIMDVNNLHLNGKNYLEMPYLLEISFFGADDAGKMSKISNHTKWIPLKLTGFKISASVKGAEYKISGVPFNHMANLESIQGLKTRMEISAKTVGDYFSNTWNTDTVASADTYRANDKRFKDQSNAKQNPGGGRATSGYKDPRLIGTTSDTESVSDATDPGPFKSTSLTAAWNAWMASEAKSGNLGQADEISFAFTDTELRDSPIVDAKKSSVRRVAPTTTPTAAKSQTQTTATTNFDSVVHDLEAGTSINDVLNIVLSQSKYFLDQAIDSSSQSKDANQKPTDDATAQDQAKPVKMWKIIPSIKLKDFDNERNQWAKAITFHVKTYTVYQNRDDRLPKSPPPSPVKEYDYFYTGHNNSIISFDIDFNALYFTAINVDRNKVNNTTGASQKPGTNEKDKPDSNADAHQIGQEKRELVADDQAAGAGGAVNRSETLNAKSALQSIYTSAAGDLINLKVQILGDPEFIKQDDLYINPTISSGPADPNNIYAPGTKSLDMDSGELYCYVTFRTPGDFNDANGMYDLDSKNKYAVSAFTGYYRIIKVSNEFRNGKFIQNLELIRQPKQDPATKGKAANTSVKSTGDDQRKKQTKAEQQSANPQVAAVDTNTPPDAQTPTQVQTSSNGPDSDATPQAPVVAKTETPVTPVSPNNTDSAPPTDLATVASSGNTVAIDQPPPTSSQTNTGEQQVAAQDPGPNKAAELAQQVQGVYDEIKKLQDRNTSIQQQLAGLNSDLKGYNDQLNTLEEQAGDNPTPDQKTQIAALKKMTLKIGNEMSSLYSEAQNNTVTSVNMATNINTTIQQSGIQNIPFLKVETTAGSSTYLPNSSFPSINVT